MSRTRMLLTLSATGLVVAATLAAQTTQTAQAPQSAQTKSEPSHHMADLVPTKSALIDKARRATEIYRDVSAAGPDYVPLPSCVAGPDEGAMGVHFINGS